MLRYQQQFAFFEMARVNESVRFVNLGLDVVNDSLENVLARIVQEVEATSPGVVVVDSFRTLARAGERAENAALDLQHFVQQLAVRLTSWEATTFLVGEYQPEEAGQNRGLHGCRWPAVARAKPRSEFDGSQDAGHEDARTGTDSRVAYVPYHRRRHSGVPPRHRRSRREGGGSARREAQTAKAAFGRRQGLDQMLGGGIPAGYSVLLAGPSGSGKSVLATEFILRARAVMNPGSSRCSRSARSSTRRAAQVESSSSGSYARAKWAVIHTRPLDLSIDEMLNEIVEAIHRLKARRLVIDSLSGFELALAPTFREDFRESLYRMVAVLTGMGITMMMTAELEDSYGDLRFSPHGTAFLTDAIIMQRYIEVKGQLHRVIAVVKVRGSAHSKDLRAFEITEQGIVMGETLGSYEGLLTGRPKLIASAPSQIKEIKPRPRR